MTSAERSEVSAMVEGLRNEMMRQLGQFERDKVSGSDEKGESGDRVVFPGHGGSGE